MDSLFVYLVSFIFTCKAPRKARRAAVLLLLGKTIHKLVHQFPKLDLSAYVQPITRERLSSERGRLGEVEASLTLVD